MLGLKGQAVDMLSANFRTSKFSKKAEHNPRLQILNIPIPKVHDDFWVFEQLTKSEIVPPRQMDTFKEYQDRFSNFREHKDKMFNIWVPFGQVDWWDLAMTTKGSAPNDGDEDFKIVDGKGPGNWWYYPNMTGIFQTVSEAMVFKSQ